MIICGDAWRELQKLESGIAQTCITSPPYWGLRDYGMDGQLGLEPTPEEYVVNLVETFRAVKRVLRDDGTLWLVLGDCYSPQSSHAGGTMYDRFKNSKDWSERSSALKAKSNFGKPKDLVGIPWRVAFALQVDGWYLRSDIIWAKPNPMPESVTDRPTSAHEHIFLLAKSQRYYYDADAIREPAFDWGQRVREQGKWFSPDNDYPLGQHTGFKDVDFAERGRNKRNVWTVATQPYPEAHFAVFPPALIEPCVLAGSAEGDTILDPFLGSGTTAEVALKHSREFIGIELNPEYAKLAEKRLREVEVVMF